MAQVIDSLIVKLDLDSSDFEAGEKKVAAGLDDTRKSTERVGKDISANGKKAAEFFGQLQSAALKFFAVLTVGRGMADFTRTIVGGGAQLDRMSTRLGTSADTLSRWQGAVRQSGGTGEGLLSTLQGLSNEMTQIAITGESSLIPMLGYLGVSLKDSNGKAKSTVDLLKDIGDAANIKIPDKANRFNILQSMGIDEGTINLLIKGSAERDKLLSSQKGFSDADARAAREAQEKWEGVKLQIERTSQEIVIKMLPVLDRLTKAMLVFAEKAVPVLLQIGDAIGDLDDKTNGWSTALLGVLATLRLIGGAGVLSGITRLAGSLGGVIAAALLLKGDESESTQEAKKLSTQAVGGDREAAVTLARTQLGNQWWRTMFGGKITEEDVQQRADSIMKGEQGDRGAPGAAGAPGGNSKSSTRPNSSSGGEPKAGDKLTRSERNNNPGNLNYAGQKGAVLEEHDDPRFAKFKTTADGVEALVKQLQLYEKRGMNTLEKIIPVFAPKNENDTNGYIDFLSKKLGVAPGESLDMKNTETLSGLVNQISKMEGRNNPLGENDVLTGIKMAGVGGKQQAPSSISIGEVKVYTQAQDANGIARDMRGAIIRQADTGVR